jgi:hypothetical protein
LRPASPAHNLPIISLLDAFHSFLAIPVRVVALLSCIPLKALLPLLLRPGSSLPPGNERIEQNPPLLSHPPLRARACVFGATGSNNAAGMTDGHGLYRRALANAPNQAAETGVLSNLAVLLMAAGRLEEAVEAMSDSIQLAEQEGLQSTSIYAGLSPSDWPAPAYGYPLCLASALPFVRSCPPASSAP